MLPKTARLPKTELRPLLRFGKRISGSFLQLTYQKSDKPQSRWLIQIPKKVVPHAVDRNHLKRLAAEAIWKLTKEKSFTGSFLVRFTGKNGSYRTISLKAVEKELQELLTVIASHRQSRGEAISSE